eukprot:4088861-Amphidinium_carterae.1
MVHPNWGKTLPCEERDHDEVEHGQPLFDFGCSAQEKKIGRPKKAMQDFLASLPSDARSSTATTTATATATSTNKTTTATALAVVQPSSSRHTLATQHATNVVVTDEKPLIPKASDRAVVCELDATTSLAAVPTIMGPMLEVFRLASTENALLDKQLLALASRFLATEKPYHLAAACIVEQETDVSRKTITLKLQRLACNICLFQRYQRAWLEDILTHSAGHSGLLLYLEQACYDETPMLTTLKTRLAMTITVGASVGPMVVPPHLSFVSASDEADVPMTLTTTGKLLQHQTGYAMLLRVVDKFFMFMSEVYNPILAMPCTTGEALKQTLDSSCSTSVAANRFSTRCRSAVVDKHGSNGLAERLILAKRPGWESLQFHCGVHIVSTCHRRTYDVLFPNDISGLIRTSLSIKQFGKMTFWRQAMQEVISKRLVVLRGIAGMAAARRRQQLLQLHFGNDKDGLQRALRLESVANGDWTNAKQVEHWIPLMAPEPDSKSLTDFVVSSLLQALASHQPRTYPRHRWTGAPEAISDIALLVHVHSLLLPVYERFQILAGGGGTSKQGLSEQAPLAGAMAAEDLEADLPLFQDSADVDAIAETSVHTGAEDGDSGGGAQAARNAKMRSEALIWISHCPEHMSGQLLLMRMIVDPLAGLLQKQLHLSSENRELEERAKVAEAMLAERENPLSQRSFPLGILASGKLEADFFESVAAVFQNNEMWKLFPTCCHTMKFRALAFKCLAKAAACVYQLYATPHQKCPMVIFKLLDDPAFGAHLSNMPPCLKDPYTLHLEKRFPTWEGEECKNVLLAHAMTTPVDISHIECKHASLRRGLQMSSVQTWRQGLSMCSALWILQNSRRHGYACVKKNHLKQQLDQVEGRKGILQNRSNNKVASLLVCV